VPLWVDGDRITVHGAFQSGRGANLGVLNIALEDGFEGDTVEVTVDGKRVFRSDAVTTRTQISLAGSFAVDVPDRPVSVDIDVPTRGVARTIEVDATKQPNLALSLRSGAIEDSYPEILGHA
jgi:hypothetical protein